MQKYSTAGSLVIDPSRKAEKFVREVSGRQAGKAKTKQSGVSVIMVSGVKRHETSTASLADTR